VLFRASERSELARNSTPRSCGETNALWIRLGSALVLSLPRRSLLSDDGFFLRKQENEAGAFAQRDAGDVRELVQPLDGL